MADPQRNRPAAVSRHQPSRLQRRAPSSLQVSRAVDWNVAIPLLSPLASSPTAAEMTAVREQEPQRHHGAAEPEKVVVFKKWQHPAAPFCYEPATMVAKFVPV